MKKNHPLLGILSSVVLMAALEEMAKAKQPEQQAAPELSQEEVNVLALDLAHHAADFPGTEHVSNAPDVMQKASDLLSFMGIEHSFDGERLMVVTVDQKQAAADFERGPLPEWATGFNDAKELVPGAQLCTRDGKRIGNAHLLGQNPVSKIWCALTDAGNHIHLSTDEVNELFELGDYISDPQSVIDRFGR